MARRPATPRGARRARAREHAALVRDQEQLWALSPGGSPDRPIPIESPVQVEPRAAATRCPLCDSPLLVLAHEAREVAGDRLRIARVRCDACGVARAIHFRLTHVIQ